MTPADIELASRTVWGESVVTEPYQFSCWLTSDPNKKRLENVGPDDKHYLLAMKAVLEVLTAPESDDPTNGAQHYHTKAISPSWASGKRPTLSLGNHLFYANID
jgi:spore germination cell wall hydrolase CwlJ-like protein